MFRNGLIFIITLLYSTSARTQETTSFKGRIYQADLLTPLSRATITLSSRNNVLTFAFSNQEGKFDLHYNVEGLDTLNLEVKLIGYIKKNIIVVAPLSKRNFFFDFYLSPSGGNLDNITIKSTWKQREKDDTIEYNASQFITPETRKVEDLLKKIDGFTIASSGKITYRGREVKALLLNGDDLTQDQYTQLSKNLAAGIVDKVQVIDNYSQNRIIGSVIKSGEVAVNLKLKESLFGRISGSVSVGYGITERYDVDGNLLLLKNRLTVVQLATANNTSKQIAGNTFFENEALSNSLEVGGNGNPQPGFELPVSGGEISQPPISSDYTLQNNTRLSSTLFHLRLNKALKVSGRAAFFKDEQINSSYASTQSFVDTLAWTTDINEQIKRNYSGAAFSLNILHDNAKNFTGSANVSVISPVRSTKYSSITSGAVNDSLKEILLSSPTILKINYSGAAKLKGGYVLSFGTNYVRLPGSTELNAATTRYASNFIQNGNFNSFLQQTSFLVSTLNTQAMLIYKRRKCLFTFKMHAQSEKLSGGNEIKGTALGYTEATLAPYNLKTNSQNKYEADFALSYNPISKIFFKLLGGAGYGRTNIANRTRHSTLWNLQADGNYKIKTFSQLSISLASVKKLPSLQLFFPDSLLNGAATIRYGSLEIQPIQYNEANFSFSYHKFSSSTSIIVNAWLKHSLRDYTTQVYLTPQLIQFRYLPVNNSISRGLLLSGKRLIYALRSTASFSVFSQANREYRVVNGQPVTERNINTNYTATLVTALKIPVNMEFSYSCFGYTGEQKRVKETLRFSNRFFTFENKVRLQISKRLYVGTLYNFLKLARQGYSHASVFGNLSLNQKASLDLKVHNLLGQHTFTRNFVSPNAVSFQSFNTVRRYVLLRYNYTF